VGRAARRFGERLGAEARRQLGRRAGQSRILEAACGVLRDYGFDPVQQSGEVRLRNCPFEAIAKDHMVLVCGMNLALAEGLLAGLGAERVEVRLDPMPGTCCVAVTPAGRKSRPSGT
jgi:predicted ArsR family transcriptional regulator